MYMKKCIILFLLLTVTAVASGQSSVVNRPKVTNQKVAVLKSSTEKSSTEKILKEKDTLKKNKIAVEVQEKKNRFFSECYRNF